MKWIPITESLPVIPEGKHSVSVIVCEYDPIYDEEYNDPTRSNGRGLSVNKFVCYGNYKEWTCDGVEHYEEKRFGFCEMINDGWISCSEQITHWMYLPEPPKYSTKYNEEKQLLEFVYEENYDTI